MLHFTYRSSSDQDLHQGDILRFTDGVRSMLDTVHPHYSNHPDYRYLLVLTQSCDLVKARGVRYITLAAVRPLATAVDREIRKFQRSPLEIEHSLCSESFRHYIEDFVRKLLDNNIPEYFYLHEDAYCGVDEACVAFLTLSVAVKAELHYATCLDARTAQLHPPFDAKLGWLVGNIYSRVGTDDWVPEHCSEEEHEARIEAILNEHTTWMEDGKLKYAKKQVKNAGQEITRELIDKIGAEYEKKVVSKREEAAALMVNIAEEVLGQPLDATRHRLLLNTFRSHPDLTKFLVR